MIPSEDQENQGYVTIYLGVQPALQFKEQAPPEKLVDITVRLNQNVKTVSQLIQLTDRIQVGVPNLFSVNQLAGQPFTLNFDVGLSYPLSKTLDRRAFAQWETVLPNIFLNARDDELREIKSDLFEFQGYKWTLRLKKDQNSQILDPYLRIFLNEQQQNHKIAMNISIQISNVSKSAFTQFNSKSTLSGWNNFIPIKYLPPKDVEIKLILLSAIKPTVSQKDQWKIAFPIQPLSANFTEMIFDRFAFDGWDFNVKLKKTSNTQVSFYLEGFHQEGKKTCENKTTNLFIKNRS